MARIETTLDTYGTKIIRLEERLDNPHLQPNNTDDSGDDGTRTIAQLTERDFAQHFSRSMTPTSMTQTLDIKPPEPFVIARPVQMCSDLVTQKLIIKFWHSRSRAINQKVTLNVGGERHDVMWRALETIPKSRLLNLSTL